MKKTVAAALAGALSLSLASGAVAADKPATAEKPAAKAAEGTCGSAKATEGKCGASAKKRPPSKQKLPKQQKVNAAKVNAVLNNTVF